MSTSNYEIIKNNVPTHNYLGYFPNKIARKKQANTQTAEVGYGQIEKTIIRITRDAPYSLFTC